MKIGSLLMAIGIILFAYYSYGFCMALNRHSQILDVSARIEDDSPYDAYIKVLCAYGVLVIGYLVIFLMFSRAKIKTLGEITNIFKERNLLFFTTRFSKN